MHFIITVFLLFFFAEWATGHEFIALLGWASILMIANGVYVQEVINLRLILMIIGSVGTIVCATISLIDMELVQIQEPQELGS